MVQIKLKKDRDRPVRMGSPWIFSGAIESASGQALPGQPCVVAANSGETLGHGYYNPDSSIAVRMCTRGNVPFDTAVLRSRIASAIKMRTGILDNATDSCRIINSEGDFVPGLVVDRFGAGLCIQILTAGMERLRQNIIETLDDILKPQFIFERSDSESRRLEGLENSAGLIKGEMPDVIMIKENGLKFKLELSTGQKTGMFLDQRENRLLVRRYSCGAKVLDCFAYTGGFSCNALAAQAVLVRLVDSSKKALDAARENLIINGFAVNDANFVEADAFKYLRECNDSFSLCIVDPPKFAKHSRDVDQACRGYKDINLLAIKRCAPSGVIFTFSCSQAVDSKLFRQVVFSAAADSRRDVQILHVLSQPPDHPVNAAHREGEYLKGLVLRVL
jgi:23S rRNA (cytosine1962-C5)-methyltransferase